MTDEALTAEVNSLTRKLRECGIVRLFIWAGKNPSFAIATDSAIQHEYRQNFEETLKMLRLKARENDLNWE